MTNREVMQQALEALQLPSLKTQAMLLQRDEAITALREALEQPEQEPHSYCYVQRGTSVDILTFDDMPQDAIANTVYPLYTAPPAAQSEPPPEWDLIKNILAEYGLDAIAFVSDWKAAQRPWQGLTPEEVKHLYPYGRSVWGRETFEAIEKALKDKNT